MMKASADREALAQAVGLLLMRLQDAAQLYDEEVGRHYGLGPKERLCLSHLMNGPSTAGAIARSIGLTPAAVTTLVDRLVAKGFAQRTVDNKDRRKVSIEAALATYELAKDTYLPMAEAGVRRLAQFHEADLSACVAILEAALKIQDDALRSLRKRDR